VDLARNIRNNATGRIPLMGYQKDRIKTIPIKPITDIETCYYFRFSALDKPGVLSAIAGILGKYGISIKTVQQKGRKTNGSVPIVMVSHLAREADVRHAFTEIGALDVVDSPPVLIRIEDENQQH
jgi:homoserine dehydrogenase